MKTTIGIVAIVFGTLSAMPAAGQSANPGPNTDGRWAPFLGCWRLAQDNVRDDSAVVPGMTVCVKPSGASAGVTMTTFAGGKIVLEQTILADGVAHPLVEPGCQGTQTSDWSRDGQRLFTTVEMACSNRPTTKASGISLFARGPAWVDIQAISADGDEHVRIRRYERRQSAEASGEGGAGEQESAAVESQAALARPSPLSPMSIEDVTEASAKVAPSALEAALAETGARFTLDSKILTTLADAGVSPNVIDLMVAQSFPTHFRVDRPVGPVVMAPQYPVTGTVGGGTTVIIGTAQYPGPYPYGGIYDPYFYNYYYYSPFAYPYYLGYYRYYMNNGTTFILPGGSGGGTGSGSGSSSGQGHVVNGRGYTRVRPNDGSQTATPAQRTPSTGNTVKSPGSADSSSPGGSGGSSGSNSSGGSSSSGGVSNSGYSGGGSGDTGRTAEPR